MKMPNTRFYSHRCDARSVHGQWDTFDITINAIAPKRAARVVHMFFFLISVVFCIWFFSFGSARQTPCAPNVSASVCLSVDLGPRVTGLAFYWGISVADNVS